MGMCILLEIYRKELLLNSSRVYLASKKSDENKTKYAIKVINKHDIRKKNLIDQSNSTGFLFSLDHPAFSSQ